MYFGEAITFEGDNTSLVHFPVPLVTKSSCLFDILEHLYEFVFESVGGVFVKDPVSTGVYKKGKCLVCIVLLVHNHHGYPLVCHKYHP